MIAAKRHRLKAQQLFMDIQLSFAVTQLTADEFRTNHHMQNNKNNLALSFVGQALPDNVHILTLEPWNHNQILLRLEHQFDVDEDAELSLPVKISLKNMFDTENMPYSILRVKEMALGANMPVDKVCICCGGQASKYEII